MATADKLPTFVQIWLPPERKPVKVKRARNATKRKPAKKSATRMKGERR